MSGTIDTGWAATMGHPKAIGIYVHKFRRWWITAKLDSLILRLRCPYAIHHVSRFAPFREWLEAISLRPFQEQP